jgi:hypothetical protein
MELVDGFAEFRWTVKSDGAAAFDHTKKRAR